MPYQVSWQFVSIKSQAPAHVLGAEAAVAGEALVGTASAARASTAHKTPAAARIVAAKMPSFVMAAPCLTIDENALENDSCKTQSASYAVLAEKFRS